MDESKKIELAQRWAKNRDVYMEECLGKEHDHVLHAIIPFSIGGGLDIYVYPNGIEGTGIATKELSETPGEGPSNKVFKNYELVMFTRHALDMEMDSEKETPFGLAFRNCQIILNMIARYAFEAKLNPGETCEFPKKMENVGGKCLIFDRYGEFEDMDHGTFGMLLVLEVHRSEMDFARRNGGEALISLLKEKGFYPYSDLDREPVVEAKKPWYRFWG
jgi:hypothetical protein